MQQNSQAIDLAMGGAPKVQPNLAAQAGINMSEVIEEFRTSREYTSKYTKDFPQLASLVDAVPLNADPDAPFVGDTTTAGLVRSIPRDSLRQLPVFAAVINGTKTSIAALVTNYLLKKYAFNEDTFGKGLLSTLQIGGEQAVTYGYAAFVVGTGVMYDDFGTTLKLLHYSDTSPEPGIQDHNETGYDYVRANLTPSRVRRIIRQAERAQETNWNIPALKALLESGAKPRRYSIYESAARQNQQGEDSSPVFEFIERLPTNTDEPIITFHENNEEQPLRVTDNRSRWGYPRVMYLVIDPAALSPFGTSRVRLASPNQNLMNIYLGNIASMLLLNSKPPVFKRGRFTSPVNLEQGVVWETMDMQATVELKTLDNGALQQFTTIAQYFAGQIQNIMGGQTMTVNAGSKASGFSRTAPGVKQADNYLESGTQQITKIMENFIRQYALVALDVLFSEQEGEDDIIVDDDTKNAINTVQAGTIGDDNVFHMQWEPFYAAIKQWSVEITVGLSKDEFEDKKRADTQDMLTVLAQNAQTIPGAAEKVNELSNMLMQDLTPLVKPPQPMQTEQLALPTGTAADVQPTASQM